jgi:hypothetical protein
LSTSGGAPSLVSTNACGAYVCEYLPLMNLYPYPTSGVLPEWSARDRPINSRDRVIVEARGGWPFWAFYGNLHQVNGSRDLVESSSIQLFTKPEEFPRCLPLAPNVLAMVNIGVCAVLLRAFIVVIAYVWSQVRKRRYGKNQCAGCGYLLLELSTCPECGLVARSSSSELVNRSEDVVCLREVSPR